MPSVASLLEQGHNQLDWGEYQAALQIFQQAAVLEPENPQIIYGLGITCYSLEQYHESIEYLNQALRIKPNYILALVWRGLVCQQIDQAQQAQADLDQAIALTPQDAFALRGRGIALDVLQRYEEAVASYDQAILQIVRAIRKIIGQSLQNNLKNNLNKRDSQLNPTTKIHKAFISRTQFQIMLMVLTVKRILMIVTAYVIAALSLKKLNYLILSIP
ncbi:MULTISPECIES: tetratricopeptide repeat protein [unclassified Nostoc]|uniref:tetratricopeptide repeat protein n=1 Tax=unclassified Nostoc TaxID=2593658 RepID=UPI002AD4EDAC|nr:MULTISPECIES: tetratricopeptide repeat protein [unclassified Nostoc]MDZ8126527.1 tetratricopeptide repeat protein [Nostoc sp. CmiVER01]MDZ8227823.1 tetratricopeptide repeat protein [Nostoc sp. ChiVER01]